MSTGPIASNLLRCLAAFIFVLYIIIPVSQSNPIASPCNPPECNSTAICENGSCVQNCDNGDTLEVCGSDGRTYANECELNKWNTLNGDNVTVKHTRRCNSCIVHKKRYEELKAIVDHSRSLMFGYIQELVNTCSTHEELYQKNSDLPFPFEPRCNPDNEDDYAPGQKNDFCALSWCSKPDGEIIKISYKQMSDPDHCSAYKDYESPCLYKGNYYKHKEDIKGHPKGACACFNGALFFPREEYAEQKQKEWSEEALRQLRADLLQSYYHQYDFAHNELRNPDIHEYVSLANMVKHPKVVKSSEEHETIISWKFDFYDESGSGVLEASEYSNIDDEVYSLIKLKTFKAQFPSLMDTDKDNTISKEEWKNYWSQENESVNVASNPVRRSILRLLRTRKNKSAH